jgi:hypothetical protein
MTFSGVFGVHVTEAVAGEVKLKLTVPTVNLTTVLAGPASVYWAPNAAVVRYASALKVWEPAASSYNRVVSCPAAQPAGVDATLADPATYGALVMFGSLT